VQGVIRFEAQRKVPLKRDFASVQRALQQIFVSDEVLYLVELVQLHLEIIAAEGRHAVITTLDELRDFRVSCVDRILVALDACESLFCISDKHVIFLMSL